MWYTCLHFSWRPYITFKRNYVFSSLKEISLINFIRSCNFSKLHRKVSKALPISKNISGHVDALVKMKACFAMTLTEATFLLDYFRKTFSWTRGYSGRVCWEFWVPPVYLSCLLPKHESRNKYAGCAICLVGRCLRHSFGMPLIEQDFLNSKDFINVLGSFRDV